MRPIGKLVTLELDDLEVRPTGSLPVPEHGTIAATVRLVAVCSVTVGAMRVGLAILGRVAVRVRLGHRWHEGALGVAGLVAGTDAAHLGIGGLRSASAAVALPEGSAARAGGVVVGWGGTVALLFAVVAGEEDLNEGGEEEKDTADGSVCHCLELYRSRLTC